MKPFSLRSLALACVAVGLPACGSGGGGGPAAPIVAAVAFLADATVVGQLQLFAADLSGSGRVDLSGPIVAGGDVASFQWSPDRSLIAFPADKETNNVREVYVVPSGGGTPVKISGTMTAGGNCTGFLLWSPDGTRIAYLADQQTDETFELWVADPAVAASAIKVSGTLVAGGDVWFFQWAPDGSRLAFQASKDVNTKLELYTVLSDGTGLVKVSGTMVTAGSNVSSFAWAPNSTRIAYRADQQADEVYELWSSPPATAVGNSRLSGSMAAGGDVAANMFFWSPLSTRIAYVADATTNDVLELYTAPAAADLSEVKVSGAMIAGGMVQTLDARPAWAPDGSRIVYAADQTTLGQVRLYIAQPLVAGSGVICSGPAGASAQAKTFVWSPDSTQIALTHDDPVSGEFRVRLSPAAGGAVTDLTDTAVAGGIVYTPSLSWAPNGMGVGYLGTLTTVGVSELYVGFLTKISGPQPAGQGVENPFQWSSDSQRIFYRSGPTLGPEYRLFSVTNTGTGLVNLSGNIVAGGGVQEMQVR